MKEKGGKGFPGKTNSQFEVPPHPDHRSQGGEFHLPTLFEKLARGTSNRKGNYKTRTEKVAGREKDQVNGATIDSRAGPSWGGETSVREEEN